MSTQPSAPRLWDTRDVADFLRLSQRQVERMRTDGSGPAYVTIGRTVRYVPGQVRVWLDGQAKHSTRSTTERTTR